jgi:hypothetical protein
LAARARDTSGKETTSAAVNVTVSTVGDPAVTGQWSSPIALPTVAVNWIMLHTGKVLFWAGEFETAPNFGELWDPATNAITPVPNPFSNIFCSAHVALADGRLLVAGGHDQQNSILGLPTSSIFNPVTETWSELPDMAFRRWYPTLTMLGDGRAIVNSGSEFNENEFVDIPEIFDPTTNTWAQLTAAPAAFPQYPMMYLLPDGRLLETGSTEHPTDTRVLDFNTLTWSVVDPRVLDGAGGVMFRPGEIMKSGSGSLDGVNPLDPSLDVTYVLDMNATSPIWRETQPMAYPRTFHNITMLPDGTALATGGSELRSESNLNPAVLAAELWSPDTETWTTLAEMEFARLYHGSAILLPDARVAAAGGGNLSGAVDMLSVEIFSPPYLFKGPRPTVTAVSTELEYATDFIVVTPDALNIASVSLVRPGAATHGFDQDQRFVPLSFILDGGDLRVQAPADGNLAPPGYYMLFVISQDGVPSVAEFVRLPAPNEDTSPPTVVVLEPVDGAILSSKITLGADATDDVAVAGVQFLLDGAPIGAEDQAPPFAVAWNTLLVANGTYTLSAVARDTAGNQATSTGITIEIANAPSSGLVGAWTFEEGAGTTTADISGNGHDALLSGASWTTNGRYGNALLFDGINDLVTIGDC